MHTHTARTQLHTVHTHMRKLSTHVLTSAKNVRSHVRTHTTHVHTLVRTLVYVPDTLYLSHFQNLKNIVQLGIGRILKKHCSY